MKTLTRRLRHRYKLGGSYLELLAQFPLRAIDGEAAYREAVDVLQRLLGRQDLDPDQRGYVDALALLVEAYEDEHHGFGEDERPVHERLNSIMRSSGMTQAELGRLLGSSGLASDLLKGKRKLSKANMKRLARHFKIDPSYFL